MSSWSWAASPKRLTLTVKQRSAGCLASTWRQRSFSLQKNQSSSIPRKTNVMSWIMQSTSWLRSRTVLSLPREMWFSLKGRSRLNQTRQHMLNWSNIWRREIRAPRLEPFPSRKMHLLRNSKCISSKKSTRHPMCSRFLTSAWLSRITQKLSVCKNQLKWQPISTTRWSITFSTSSIMSRLSLI